MKRQLLFGLFGALIMLSAFGYFSISKMQELSDVTKSMYKHPFTITNATRSIQAKILDVDLMVVGLMQTDENKLVKTSKVEKIQKKEEEIDALFKTVFQKYLGDLSDIERAYKSFLIWRNEHAEIIKLIQNTKKYTSPLSIYHHKHYNQENFYSEVDKIVDFADNKAKVFYDRSLELRQEVISMTLFTLLGGFLLLIFGGLFISRNISRGEDSLVKQKEDLFNANIRMKLAQESAGFGIWDYDISSGKLIWDDWMLKIYGIKRCDFTEEVNIWVDGLHDEDRDETIKRLEKAKKGDEDYDVIFRIVRFDGAVRHLQGNAVCIRDENGNAVRMVGINYDITEFIENEEKLRERDLQLMQQSRMAQMGEMVSMIAHQWRQPLSAIAATSINMKLQFELDCDDLCSETKRNAFIADSIESLDDIDTFVRSLTNTIDDFRTFYKPDKLPVTITTNKLIRKALHIADSSIKEKSTIIDVSCEDELTVHVFENELIQVLLNLIKNAQDNFLEKNISLGKIAINCSFSDNSVFISVCDNGGGIPKDVLPKIFEPYFSTKHQKNGTGLGLYMSKTIIEEHHCGKLSVQNNDDGCCFTIALPIDKELPDALE